MNEVREMIETESSWDKDAGFSGPEPRACDSSRIALLDQIRGFTLLHMIAYHTIWDLVNLFDRDIPWFQGLGPYLWQQAICWTFILLAGYCWPLGKHPLRRGLTIAASGFLVFLVTAVAPVEQISFGILILLSACTLLLIPLDPLLRRAPAAAGAGISMLFFLLTRNIGRGQLGFERMVIAKLPEALYQGRAAAFLGFPDPSFYSTDYFPMLPWMFLFFAGYFLHRFRPPVSSAESRIPAAALFQFLGRHSLAAYLLHQPVLYIAGCLLFGSP